MLSLRNSRWQRRTDFIFRILTVLCASVIAFVLVLIIYELFVNSGPSFKKFGLRFLVSSIWNPVTGEFGALSSIFGTIVSTIIAMALAVPLAIVTALFLTELVSPAISKLVGIGIELLAAVPSIIYGMWGLFVFAPFMSNHIQPALAQWFGFLPLFSGPPMGIGMLTAGIILALMVVPFICAVTRDVFLMVPSVIKESAFGMGATTWEATSKVTIRYGLQGIIGACFLGLGRAIGETMAVTFVIGNDHNISASLFSAGNSIASTLANEFSEASDPLYLSSLVELGLTLFLITIVIQSLAWVWLRRMKRKMRVTL